MVLTYNLDQHQSIFEALDYVVGLSSDEILELRKDCLELAESYDWKKTIMPMNNCLS